MKSLLGALLIAVSSSAGAQGVSELCTEHTLQTQGISLFYRTCGQGPPLLLLHAFNESGASRWDRFIPALAATHRLIVPDMRGHGKSTNPSGGFKHRQSAQDILALLDSLALPRVSAIGASSGGITLLHIATQQPARLDAMVLIGTATYYPEAARKDFRAATVESLTPEQYRTGRERHAGGDEQTRLLQRARAAFANDFDDVNFTPPYLSTVTARTLIIHGDRDRTLPLEIPMQLYAAIPKAYLSIVPNGGHVPIAAHPDEFLTQVKQFLAGAWN